MNARELLRGALGGALLALARPPAGLTLDEWMTPTGERRALWFALALAVVALPHLVRPARGASGAATLAGCAVGFAPTGLFAMDVLAPESQGVLFLMALAVLAASVLLAPRATSEAPAEPISPVWEGWFAPTAVAAAGAGLARVQLAAFTFARACPGASPPPRSPSACPTTCAAACPRSACSRSTRSAWASARRCRR